jgi:hypothetical protein
LANIPRAHPGASGLARKISSVPVATSRQKLVKADYFKDLQQGSGSAGTDPSKEQQLPKGQHLAAPVGISPLLKRVAKELSAITGNEVVPVVEDFPVNPDVQRLRTRPVSKIVPPAQSLIENLWVPDRGAIRPQIPRGGFDPTKLPFTIDGKSLQPVLERYDQGRLVIPIFGYSI